MLECYLNGDAFRLWNHYLVFCVIAIAKLHIVRNAFRPGRRQPHLPQMMQQRLPQDAATSESSKMYPSAPVRSVSDTARGELIKAMSNYEKGEAYVNEMRLHSIVW